MQIHDSRDQEGQSVVLIALALIALVGIVGLVVDGGRVYGARRESQNGSDAAAFAGASILAARTGSGPSDDAKVRDAVRAYALNNGIAATGDITAWYTRFGVSGVSSQVGSGTIPSDANGVKVQTRITLQTFLIGVVTGGNAGTVQTQAIAKIGVLTSPSGLRPVTIKDQDFVIGQQYKLQGDDTAPGNFQYLNLEGINDLVTSCPSPDNPTLEWNLDDDNSPNIGHVDVDNLYICGNPGEHASVKDTLKEWFDDYPSGPRYWLIPIYDTVEKQGNNVRYHIVKFAVFDLSGYYISGGSTGSQGADCDPQPPGNKCIAGRFVRYASLGDIDEGENCYTSEVDVCGVKMTE